MSRGHGRIQVSILGVLNGTEENFTTYDLAALALGLAPDDDGVTRLDNAQLTTVRRALGKLRREGLVFDCGRHRYGRRVWAARVGALRYRARILRDFGLSELQRIPDLAQMVR